MTDPVLTTLQNLNSRVKMEILGTEEKRNMEKEK
jgi:hypothetical protein